MELAKIEPMTGAPPVTCPAGKVRREQASQREGEKIFTCAQARRPHLMKAGIGVYCSYV